MDILSEMLKENPKMVADQWMVDFMEKVADITSNIIQDKQGSTIEEILEMLTGCRLAFSMTSSKNVSPEVIEGCFDQYVRFLESKSAILLSEAFKNIIMKNKFFPAISDILSECKELQEGDFTLMNIQACNLHRRFMISMMPRTKEYYQNSDEHIKDYCVRCEYENLMNEHYRDVLWSDYL